MIDVIAKAGLDARVLCTEAGIDLQALALPHAKCSSEKINLLWHLAVQRSGNPAIALIAPEAVRPASFDVVGYAMMSSPNLLAAFERLARYLRILTDATSVSLEMHGQECYLTYDIFGDPAVIPRQRFEFGLITFLAFCRWIAASDIRPRGALFKAGVPRTAQPYRDAFRCPVRFNAVSNTLIFSRSDLDLPLPTSNATLVELHDRLAGEQIDRLQTTRIDDLARSAIISRLPDGEPTRNEIAAALGLSARTLQRRFADEGGSFHQLLDNVRRELAQRYISQQQVSLSEAAYLLGFASQVNFTRAFKRWFDLAPGQYRARLTDSR